MSANPRLHVFVPFWGLAGGVIKILDYAEHGLKSGYTLVLWSGSLDISPEAESLPVLRRLLDRPDVEHRSFDQLPTASAVGEQDRVLFTEPGHAQLVDALTPAPAQVIQLVQGTRHADPTWNSGLHYRLLHRPLVRIAVTAQVHAAIAPVANTRLPIHTVLEGHDVDYFETERGEQPESAKGRLRVLYSTWKSDVGDRVAEACGDDPGLHFIAMRSATPWPSLRNRYRGTDLFLGTPGPEEGFYLPGLEAMAAGAALVMPLVGGNASYCRPGENMLSVAFEDVADYREAILALRAKPDLLKQLVEAGRQTIDAHRLERERREFATILANPSQNYADAEPTDDRHGAGVH